MDKKLTELESRLETLVPRGLSDHGRERCEALIDELALANTSNAHHSQMKPRESMIGMPWHYAAAAATVMLGVGMGSGWYLGKNKIHPSETFVEAPALTQEVTSPYALAVPIPSLEVQGETPESLVSVEENLGQIRDSENGREVDVRDESGNLLRLRISPQ